MTIKVNNWFVETTATNWFFSLKTILVTCQDHGEFTGIVGVVIPGLVFLVPGMESAWKTYQSVPIFPPNSKRKYDFVMTQMGVIVHGKHSLGFNSVIWHKSRKQNKHFQ